MLVFKRTRGRHVRLGTLIALLAIVQTTWPRAAFALAFSLEPQIPLAQTGAPAEAAGSCWSLIIRDEASCFLRLRFPQPLTTPVSLGLQRVANFVPYVDGGAG